jgi:hypothetical protein
MQTQHGTVEPRATQVYFIMVENHAHFHSLTGLETDFPVRFQVDVAFRSYVLDSEFPFVDFLGAIAMLSEIDLEDGHECLSKMRE